jgi:hypothetical protein
MVAIHQRIIRKKRGRNVMRGYDVSPKYESSAPCGICCGPNVKETISK